MKYVSAIFLGAAAGLVALRANRKKVIDMPRLPESEPGTASAVACTAAVLSFYRCGEPAALVSSKFPHAGLCKGENGLLGKNPSEYFIDLPDGSPLGCRAPVVAAAMNCFLARDGWRKAVVLTGAELPRLLKYVDRGDPVILWATRGMRPSASERLWRDDRTGEPIRWKEPLHCFLLIGHDRSGYFFSDPDVPNGIIHYEKELVEQRYFEMGKQAVAALV